jgi:hypothetical protein
MRTVLSAGDAAGLSIGGGGKNGRQGIPLPAGWVAKRSGRNIKRVIAVMAFIRLNGQRKRGAYKKTTACVGTVWPRGRVALRSQHIGTKPARYQFALFKNRPKGGSTVGKQEGW